MFKVFKCFLVLCIIALSCLLFFNITEYNKIKKQYENTSSIYVKQELDEKKDKKDNLISEIDKLKENKINEIKEYEKWQKWNQEILEKM